MDKRVRLNKYRSINNCHRYACQFKKDIYTNFIRIIFTHDINFSIGFNNNSAYYLYKDGKKYNEVMLPYYDEFEKYYYYDVKFYEYTYIFNILVYPKQILHNNFKIFAEFDGDSDVDIIYDQSDDLLYDINIDDYEIDKNGTKSYKNHIYIKLINKESKFKEIDDYEILEINNRNDIDIKNMGNDIYKIIFFDDEPITDLLDEIFKSNNISFIITDLPIKNFPDYQYFSQEI